VDGGVEPERVGWPAAALGCGVLVINECDGFL
jgi:hypothetical protein